MLLHHLKHRHIPDWQADRIDGKARWLVPWAIFSVLLFAAYACVLSPWFLDGETLKFKRVHRLPLNLADDTVLKVSNLLVIRIDSNQRVHVGEAVFEFFVSPEYSKSISRVTDPIWRRQLHCTLQTEIKKPRKIATIVIEVAPNTPWEVIANVCGSVRSVSDAQQYLKVNN